MKSLPILLLPAVLACALSARAGVSRDPGPPETVTLDNGLLRITVAPALNGTVCGWEYLPQKRAFIRPLKYRVEKVDLLPDRIFTSQDGFRCRLWGIKHKFIDTMRVEQLEAGPDGGCVLTMTAPQTCGQELSLVSRMHLLAGSTVLTGSFEVTNRQKAAGTFSLWFNCVLFMSSRPEPVLVPVRSGVERIGKLGMTPAGKDGVLTELHDGSRNMYFAALRPWVAKVAADRPGVAVLKVDDPAPGKMVLYTHKSDGLHTMEILSSPEKTGVGKTLTRKFELLYFPSLSSLREVCGRYGIDVKDGALVIEAACPVPESVWTVNGKKYDIPALGPGRLHRIESVCRPGQPVKITVGGKEYNIPGQLSADLKTVR